MAGTGGVIIFVIAGGGFIWVIAGLGIVWIIGVGGIYYVLAAGGGISSSSFYFDSSFNEDCLNMDCLLVIRLVTC